MYDVVTSPLAEFCPYENIKVFGTLGFFGSSKISKDNHGGSRFRVATGFRKEFPKANGTGGPGGPNLGTGGLVVRFPTGVKMRIEIQGWFP